MQGWIAPKSRRGRDRLKPIDWHDIWPHAPTPEFMTAFEPGAFFANPTRGEGAI
jgi:hypothetical protein